jgi:hypothetical protein
MPAVAVLTLGTLAAGPARAAFEDIEVSPQARAIGGSWVALVDDPYAPLHNPAALAWAKRAVAVSYVRPFGYGFAGQCVVTATAALPGSWGGAGLGIRHFGVEYQHESLTSETTVSFAHGFRLLADRQSELSLGWSLNYLALEYGPSVTGIDPGHASSVTLNLGGHAVIRGRTRVGFQTLNVTDATIGDFDKEPLRRGIWAGLSYAPYPGVITVLDMASELGRVVQYRGGAEFQVAEFAWLRAGVRTEPNVFTGGFGLEHRGLRLDYGFSTGGGVLAETHQIGVGFGFAGAK